MTRMGLHLHSDKATDADDHQLHYRNMAHVASTPMEMEDRFVALGLVARPGEVL